MSTSSIATNGYIFDRLTLYNFKMHKNTELVFSDLPITVISGANGSGKTQLLEALILSIGHTPSRVSLSAFKDLIGPFAEYCSIELFLNNPFIAGMRIFLSSDPDLEHFVNQDHFSIKLTIDSQGIVKRKIISEKGEEKTVTKRQIQNLMRSVGIFEDSMLNFSEEGYLSSFADDSPHKKLETLLIATGLKEVYSSYLHSKKRVEEKEREISPLTLQLERERRKLEKLKENYERLQQKKELISRFEYVEKELLWFDIQKSKEQLDQTEKEIELKKKELSSLKGLKQKKEAKLEEVNITIKVAEPEYLEAKIKIRELSDNLNKMRGQKYEKDLQIKNKKESATEIMTKIKKFQSLHLEEGKKEKLNIQSHYEKILKQISDYEETLLEIRADYKIKSMKMEEVKDKIKERSTVYGELSDYERKLVHDCIAFKEEIKDKGYSKSILGPVYELIEIKKEHKDLEDVIKAAIGKYLFGFVATNYNAYTAAKELFDKHFPSYKPNITVGRVLEEEQSPKPDYLLQYKFKEKPEGIIDYVVNLIDSPDQVKIYLKRFVKTIIAESYLSVNKLTDLSKQLKTRILTSDGKSLFLPQEAFTRPPRKYNIKLNVDLSKYQSIERLREQLSSLLSELQLLKEKERTIKEDLIKQELQKKEIESALQPWTLNEQELETSTIILKKKLLELQNEIKEDELSLKKFDEKIKSVSEEISLYENSYAEKELEVDQLKKRQNKLKQELEDILEKISKLQRIVEVLSYDAEEFKKTYSSLISKAKEKGEVLTEIRTSREEILSEYNQIKGQLELLEITTDVSEQTIQEQEKRLELIEGEYKENEKHLKNLKTDLVNRIAEWETGLTNIVTHLNNMLNLLLKDVFKSIDVRITNYYQEQKASLVIEAVTKGDNRNYRQLSGGEKTLIAQAIILALHMINQSPIHAIDEFTQKLDKRNRTIAFSMALTTYKLAKTNRSIIPQFILITPMLDNVELSKEFSHKVLVESMIPMKEVEP
ncbi:MAG: AAA family ATPase [Candidatus Heimdallarchaeaceae archaeon]